MKKKNMVLGVSPLRWCFMGIRTPLTQITIIFFFSSRFSSSSLERWMRVDCRWTNENINKRQSTLFQRSNQSNNIFWGNSQSIGLFLIYSFVQRTNWWNHFISIPSSNTFFFDLIVGPITVHLIYSFGNACEERGVKGKMHFKWESLFRKLPFIW